MGKAISTTAVMTKRFTLMPFDGVWRNSIGQPCLTGSWLIWGNKANGKTRLALQAAKYISQFSRIVIDSLEEGLSPTMQIAYREVGMDEVNRRVILVKEPVNELIERLERKKSPQVAIIDSVQYSGLKYRDYVELKNRFPNKLLIFISHADGKEPRGSTAKSIMYDADVCLRVEGFKALIAKSRYGGGEPYIIWQQGSNEYWGENM